MEHLTIQVATFESIKTLCSNYKKDSTSRKTETYLQQRLSALDKYWEEFDERHQQKLESIEEKAGISYFSNDIYGKTRQMYETTKQHIKASLSTLRKQEQDFGESSTQKLQDKADEKTKELMEQQEVRFKSLNRTMLKINLELVTEKWELEDFVSILKSKWNCIEKAHWEIEGALKDQNLQEEYNQRFEEIELKYDSLRRGLHSKMWSNVHYQRATPQIEIPEFSGNYIQWISFKDIFLETIHSNPTIPKSQKMQHLKTKLKGEAERLVQHLTISADNYDSCWEILTHRYDNRRLQFTSFMNTMQQLPLIQHPNANNLKRMHDVITESLNGLANMSAEISSWGPIIVHYMSQKLDSVTFNEYVKDMQNSRELPNLQEFLSFLESKFIAYETMKNYQRDTSNTQKQLFNKPNYNPYFGNRNNNFKSFTKQNNYAKKASFHEGNREFTRAFHTSYGQCPLCEGSHVLMQCDKFINLDTAHRNKTVAKLKVCKNCLYSHGDANCTSMKTCKECNSKHHTLLHMTKENTEKSGKTVCNYMKTKPSISSQQGSYHLNTNNTEILLTTVQVKIKSITGTYITMRALLDQGSQVNLITENAAQQLRLPRSKLHATISGVGSVAGSCKGSVHLSCKSIHSDYNFEAQALVLQKLTSKLPNCSFKRENWEHLKNLKLADPEYNVSDSIDLLLGAEVYSDIILDGVLKGNQDSPTAQHTQLGWILCGKLKTFHCHITLLDTTDLSRYWESEDITVNSTDISQEDHCEIYYKETTRRGPDGKYIVKMPMIKNYEENLGKSKSTAISQYLQLEKRLKRNEQLSLMYKDFMNEYLQLQHMKLIEPRLTSQSNPQQCFLPHHGVIRENSSTTKLRVVFNASQANTNGKSLNSLMEKGPNLQKDIQDLILKWRTYKYVFTADIEKMYRCIWLDEQQQHLQKIIWRNSSDEMLQEYALCTVTYGTKCAPWLAMRTLKQLAIDERKKYPVASQILENECYVDDVISGHNDLETAKMLQTQLLQLLRSGGMNLRKWSSNNTELIESLSEDQVAKTSFNFKQEDSTKTLGLGWNSHSDTFTFNWKLKEESKKSLTKRTLLSQISQLYDPLGWLSPITIKAKLLFQHVWTEKLEWDNPLPVDIQTNWMKLKEELPETKNLKLNRWIGSQDKNIELLGFSDASEKAFACVIYTRTMNEHGQPVITLLTAKTRVAPLAQKLSLPRLELCGALLLSRLMDKATKALKEFNVTVWAFCDSKVVLAWLQGEASKYERYVENRVLNIKKVIPASQWSYIESKNNPADCATRGLYPKKLLNTSLWWTGPELLHTFKSESQIEKSLNCLFTTNTEEKHVATTLKQTEENIIINLLIKHSSLTRVTRIIAWILRFCKNARSSNKTMIKYDTVLHAPADYLVTKELNESMNIITKNVQRNEFETEYNLLSKNQPLSNKSPLCKFNPYLDKNGILRVGGRLNKTNLPGNMKNPAILSRNGRLTQLIINQAHHITLHGGARLTLANIRQQFWILGGNRAVKSEIRKCIRCLRFKTTDNHQIMADLPSARVTPARPFTHTGVDFTGHVDVKLNKGRGVKTSKGYIAIFICMATKAVHIELVSDLSTEAFILAFQRMCSRRGTPQHVYSDCGTNFIGASRMLNNEYELFEKELSADFFDEISKMKVEWHFNAPAWPTAGGIWEASVRSMKHHLRRVLGEQKLTYEEFSTLLSKIEACMNSRPLCALTEDPDEFFNYLTPGHFLTGSPTMTLPISDYEDDRHFNLRKRWQLTEHMHQRFWKVWSNDYLTSLQARSKWRKPTPNIKKGDIVLVRENNLPPGKWAMGRVIEVHPGSDNRVRVTTIKTQFGTLKRPITKLSLLPIEGDNNKTNESADQAENRVNYTYTTARTRQFSTGKNKYFTTMLTTLLTMFVLIMGSNGSPLDDTNGYVQVTTLGRDRPIYYDTIGKVQIIHDEWRLLMYHNLTTYWNGVERINGYLQGLQTLCERIDPRYCETTLRQLAHEQEILHYYNNVLLSPHKQLSGRSKRGLINGIGSLANDLFGVLDQRFADKYEADIQAVQSNEDHLLQLIKNQTSIVELENEILKRNEENINRQFTVINNFMNQTDLRLASIESELEISMAASFISSASLTAYLLLTSLKNTQQTLYDTLMDIYKGHMNVELLTPANLIEQLDKISGRLPKTLTLPVQNIQTDIRDLYKLLFVKARITDSYFLFEVHIPLASNEDYNLFRVIPLPMKNSQTAEETLTVVSTNYIAVNLEKNAYTNLSEKELNRCIQRSLDNIVCIINLPIYNLQNQNAPCEAKLIGHQTTSPCTGKKMKCEANWIELHTTNTWLAVCCDLCTFRIVCAGDVKSIVINASSIISLREGCLIQTKDMTIYSHSNYDSQARIDYSIQLPTLNKSINSIIEDHRTFQVDIIEDNTINDVKNELKNLKLREHLPAVLTTHDIHQYVVCYLLLAVTAVAIIIWTVKTRGCCTQKSKRSQDQDVELQSFNTTLRQKFRPGLPPAPEISSDRAPQPSSASGALGRDHYARPNIRRAPNPITDVEFNL